CFSTNQYDQVFHPQGYQYVRSFCLNPFPTTIYQIEGVTLQKEVFLVYGQNTLVIQYTVLINTSQDKDIRLELRPLTAFRNYHQIVRKNTYLDPSLNVSDTKVSIRPYTSLPSLFFAHNAVDVQAQGVWYENFFYVREEERGLEAKEDLFNPCVFIFDLNKGAQATVVVSLQEQDIAVVSGLRNNELKRRKDLVQSVSSEDVFKRHLVIAADQFIVKRQDQQIVITGYPWFEDWGRDTMIALPGLTLATGRFEDAKSILLSFTKQVNQGMVPNRCVTVGQKPEYNTVDAALWFFETVRLYGEYTGKWSFIKEHFYLVLEDIIDWYRKGTRYNIHMDQDGLIDCGQGLTWMDARSADGEVTPRHGKPVEVQALWYNALCVISELAKRYDDSISAEQYAQVAQIVKKNFNRLFWNEDQGGLYDVIRGKDRDDTIRPNQLLAMSLRYSILDTDKFPKVLSLVENELLTPMGLRTLSAKHPHYKGVYIGNLKEREEAYHQGTVWPWLMGPFISALLKTEGRNTQTMERVRGLLKPFEEHLRTAGLGQISEICDGDSPYIPRGCIAQAWSVAELLRVLSDHK
ncbi:MAG: glycogen debranching enzyme family protein, partial [Candidatus Omnitrophica bacterium]|nr:glycogen debranching enzyme family protein [Candidatus Omnitrophota bacterium]